MNSGDKTNTLDIEVHSNLYKNMSNINSNDMESNVISQPKVINEYEGINGIFVKNEITTESCEESIVEDDVDPLCILIKDSDVKVQLEEQEGALTNENSGEDLKQNHSQKLCQSQASENLESSLDKGSFSCTICQYKSTENHQFLLHLTKHQTLGNSFSCGFCSYTSHSNDALKNHISIHTEEKIFCCEMCSFKTTKLNTLRNHIFKHTAEKPFSCKHCDFKTNSVSNLKYHLMRHTGEKPFACELCSYKTNQKSALRRHILNTTVEKPFSCEFCVFKSCAKTTFKAHMATHGAE